MEVFEFLQKVHNSVIHFIVSNLLYICCHKGRGFANKTKISTVSQNQLVPGKDLFYFKEKYTFGHLNNNCFLWNLAKTYLSMWMLNFIHTLSPGESLQQLLCRDWDRLTGERLYDLRLRCGYWALISEMVLSVMLSVVSVQHLCGLAVMKVCGMNRKQLRFNLCIGTSAHLSLAHFYNLSSELNRMT